MEMILDVAKLLELRILRYAGASVAALSVDLGTFGVLLMLGMAAVPASAVGYCAGIAAHWLVSSRAVFHREVAAERGARMRQKVLFAVSAVIGLSLTTAIVGASDAAGMDPRFGKIIAVVVSFAATYLLRARIVFGKKRWPSIADC